MGGSFSVRSRDQQELGAPRRSPSLYSYFAYCLGTLWDPVRPWHSLPELRRQGKGGKGKCLLCQERQGIQPGHARETRAASQLGLCRLL